MTIVSWLKTTGRRRRCSLRSRKCLALVLLAAMLPGAVRPTGAAVYPLAGADEHTPSRSYYF